MRLRIVSRRIFFSEITTILSMANIRDKHALPLTIKMVITGSRVEIERNLISLEIIFLRFLLFILLIEHAHTSHQYVRVIRVDNGF